MNEKTTPRRQSKPPRQHPVQKYLSLLQRGGDVRRTKVRRLRAALREERYENELKFSVAVERLFREL